MQTKPRDVKYCGVNAKKIKKAEPYLHEENTAHLLHFIVERYRIHVKKDILKKPRPWTNDPILQSYKFTNVFREDDRVSRALIELVSTNKQLTLEEKILNTFLLRSWNNPDTFTDFGGPWTAKEIYNGLDLKERVRPLYHRLLKADPDRKWWSSAYNQGGVKSVWKFPSGNGHIMGADKNDIKSTPGYESDIPLRVFHIGPCLKEKNIVERLLKADNQKQAYEIIREVPGCAEFMAYQIFVDLAYIKEFPFSENEFVIAGPGCKRGLDYLFTDYGGLTYEESLFWLRDNIDEYFIALQHGDYAKHDWDPEKLFKRRPEGDRCLNIMALENCFCELSKYLRAYYGTGRPRKHYTPTVGGWHYQEEK